MSKITEQKKQGKKVADVEQPTEEPAKTDLSNTPSFSREINAFALEIESLSRAKSQAMKAVINSTENMVKSLTTFIDEKGITDNKEEGKHIYKTKLDDLQLLNKWMKDIRSSSFAIQKTPQIFFCALIHQYDAFLGKLLRVIFCVKPEFLNASQKQITFSELMSFGSLDEALQHLVEKEIESIIRESHVDQLKWMENKFKLPLRKGLSAWPLFIEITERRNLFVHCDGVVSSQYLTTCRSHKIKLEKGIKL